MKSLLLVSRTICSSKGRRITSSYNFLKSPKTVQLMNAMATDTSQYFKTEVSEEQVNEALTVDKGKLAKVLSWKIENFTKKGDNYSGDIKSLKVRYSLDQTQSEASYVVKINPYHQMTAYREVNQIIFQREARFYSEVAPSLNAKLINIGQPPLRIPSCYYINLEPHKEMIILEDLRNREFKMHDRKKGMDTAHTNLVLMEFARLHASSLLLQSQDGYQDLDDVYSFFTKDWFNMNEDAKIFSTELLQGSIDNALTILSKVGGYDKAVSWLNELKPHVYEKYEAQLGKDSPFTVICHGDCWNNNALFRYCKEGQPVEIMFLDLQLIRRASLATDLTYFALTSLVGSDRRKNFDAFLNTYYLAFQQVIESGGLEMPFNLEELKEEYKDKCLYGVISSLGVVPLVVSDGSDLPGFENLKDGQMEEFVKEQEGGLLQMLEKNPLLRSRFLSIFEEMVDHGIIP